VLTITRRVGERIYIGDDIVIVVNAIRGKNNVRIGVKAPRDVRISRGELVDGEVDDMEFHSDSRGRRKGSRF
jgi:carbon storage regulator